MFNVWWDSWGEYESNNLYELKMWASILYVKFVGTLMFFLVGVFAWLDNPSNGQMASVGVRHIKLLKAIILSYIYNVKLY
jgi:hypothetical protein